MPRNRALILCVAFALLLAMLACQMSTALMSDDQLMSHVIDMTPWP